MISANRVETKPTNSIPDAHHDATTACLPRHPAVAYLCLVRSTKEGPHHVQIHPRFRPPHNHTLGCSTQTGSADTARLNRLTSGPSTQTFSRSREPPRPRCSQSLADPERSPKWPSIRRKQRARPLQEQSGHHGSLRVSPRGYSGRLSTNSTPPNFSQPALIPSESNASSPGEHGTR